MNNDEALQIMSKKAIDSIHKIAETLNLDKKILLNNKPEFKYVDDACASSYDVKSNVMTFGRVLDRVAPHEIGHYIHYLVKKFYRDAHPANSKTALTDNKFDPYELFHTATQEAMARFSEGICGISLTNRWDTSTKIPALEKELEQLISTNAADNLIKQKNYELDTLKIITRAKSAYDGIVKMYIETTKLSDAIYNIDSNSSPNRTLSVAQTKYDTFVRRIMEFTDYKTLEKYSSPYIEEDGELVHEPYNYVYLYHWIGEEQGMKLYNEYASGNMRALNAVKKLMTVKDSHSFWLLESYTKLSNNSPVTNF